MRRPEPHSPAPAPVAALARAGRVACRHGMAVLGAAAVCLAAAPASASAPDLFGFGARGIGLGNAIYASPRGFEAVWYNPAGMAFDTERSFRIGYQYGHFALDVNDERWDALHAPALVLGFGVPIPFGPPLTERLTVGLGFVLPTTSILIADTKAPGQLSMVLLENRAQTVSVMIGAGIRILDELSIGWSMLALAELEGGIEVAPNDAGRLGSQAHDQLVADYSHAVGIVVRPIADRLAFGATWRQVSTANYALPISVDLGNTFPIPVPLLDISGTAQFDPEQVGFSVWAHPVERLEIELAGVWKRWSAFPNPIVYTAVPDDYPTQPLPDFHDTWGVRLGVATPVERSKDVFTPRAGFMWEPSPAPEQTGLHNHLDNNRAITSLGLGYRRGVLSVDAAWQMHTLLTRTSRKDACVVADDGTSDLPPEEGAAISPTYPNANPGCPSVTHGGSVQLVNVELGVSF